MLMNNEEDDDNIDNPISADDVVDCGVGGDDGDGHNVGDCDGDGDTGVNMDGAGDGDCECHGDHHHQDGLPRQHLRQLVSLFPHFSS